MRHDWKSATDCALQPQTNEAAAEDNRDGDKPSGSPMSRAVKIQAKLMGQ